MAKTPATARRATPKAPAVPTTPARPIKPAPAAGVAHAAAPPPAKTVLRVRATRTGYYGEARRREGDVFTLEKVEHFTDVWMEPVSPAMREHTTSSPAALKKHHDELIRERFAKGHGGDANDESEHATGDLNPLLS